MRTYPFLGVLLLSCMLHPYLMTSFHILDIMSSIFISLFVTKKRKKKFISLFYSGDSNRVDDRRAGIYLHGQLWLQRQHIIARAIWWISSILLWNWMPLIHLKWQKCYLSNCLLFVFLFFIPLGVQWRICIYILHLQVHTICWLGENYHGGKAHNTGLF